MSRDEMVITISNYLSEYDNEKGEEILLEKIEELRGKDSYIDVCIDSIIVKKRKSMEAYKRICNFALMEGTLNYQQVYFLYSQLMNIKFIYSFYNTDDNFELCIKILKRAVDMCYQLMDMDIQRIPKDELTGNTQVVITQQFLTDGHGPTKSALDRCVTIKRKYSNVLLINTADLLPETGKIPMYGITIGNYIKEYDDVNYQEWEGERIPYFQCSREGLPDVELLKYLFNTIISLKPKVVVSIAGGGLLEAIVDKAIPVLTVGMTSTGPVESACSYQTIRTQTNETMENRIRLGGFDRNKMIGARFTYSIKPKVADMSRKELGIREDTFALVCVGGRLDVEITDEFLEMIDKVNSVRIIQLVVMGRFTNNEYVKSKYPNLFVNFVNLGMQDDVQAVYENCDLYVNPTRRGGGTSAIEVMYAGKPVVTVDYGDVAEELPTEYRCKDYDEMYEIILKYIDDKDYYNKQSETGRIIADEYLDSKREFSRVLDEYVARRELYK